MNDMELLFGILSTCQQREYSFDELKYLTAPFNITETSLRTSLSRMIRKNMLQSGKEGKTAFYGLSRKGTGIQSNVAFSMKSPDWSNWDRKWWGIQFTVPDKKDSQRHEIRKKLTAYRFASLYPGFWIRPRHPSEKMEIHLESLIQSENCTWIVFDFFRDITKETISRVWKLDEINASFSKMIQQINEYMAAANEFTPEQGFQHKIELGNEIVKVLFHDPILPDEFLPDNWKGNELRELSKRFDKEMTRIARPYVKKVIIEEGSRE